MYPDLTSKEREHAYVKDHHTTCILQIGGALASGKPHDLRAPDYDDWQLNCDILFWNPVLGRSFEISSMGIPKYREILKASRMDGLYRPFSREPIVCRETSKTSASSSCLIPLAFRSSSNLFFNQSPPMESLLYI